MNLGITTLARVPLELNAKLNIIKDWLGVTSAELLNSLLREEVDRLYLEAIEGLYKRQQKAESDETSGDSPPDKKPRRKP